MKKHFYILILLVIVGAKVYGQNGKAILILKDSTQIHGIGEVSGYSSIVSVRFKNDTLKYKRYKSKDIIGINILENDYFREFRYKYIDGAKFPEILEVVSIDSLSLYVRIYGGTALSNTFPTENSLIQGGGNSQEVSLSNGQNIRIAQRRNRYNELNFPRYSYYVGYGKSDQVEHLYSKGLPFATSFKKSIKMYFKKCPSLIEKINLDEFSKENLLEVINFYNLSCLRRITE